MKHICHVSVLNPLKHSRIYYRWGLGAISLGYEVSIFAQGEADEITDSPINFYATGSFSRLSIKRLFFSFRQRRKLLKLKADIYVLHSPELLPLGKWLQKKTRAKIIFDVHEDYYKNIIHAPHYPNILKKPLASLVRKQEMKATNYLDAVVYAEECYEEMLTVPKEQIFLLRNKFVQPTNPLEEGPISGPYMLTTGTLAWPWGLRESYELWKTICKISPIRWVVAGHSNDESVLDFLENEVGQSEFGSYFTLIGGRRYVPYSRIIALIKNCLFGTGFYHLQPNIAGKIPTKFYEFMALKKPLLFTKEQVWNDFNEQNRLGFSLFLGECKQRDRVEQTLEKVKKWKPVPGANERASFKSEIPELKRLLEGLYH